MLLVHHSKLIVPPSPIERSPVQYSFLNFMCPGPQGNLLIVIYCPPATWYSDITAMLLLAYELSIWSHALKKELDLYQPSGSAEKQNWFSECMCVFMYMETLSRSWSSILRQNFFLRANTSQCLWADWVKPTHIIRNESFYSSQPLSTWTPFRNTFTVIVWTTLCHSPVRLADKADHHKCQPFD